MTSGVLWVREQAGAVFPLARREWRVAVTLAAGGMLLFALPVAFIVRIDLSRYVVIPGRVISSQVYNLKAGAVNLYIPRIRYVYQSDGQAYVGNVYCRIIDNGSEEWALAVVRGFVPGQPCVVYVDPCCPGRSVLTSSLTRPAWMVCILSSVVGALAVVRVAACARKSRVQGHTE